MAKMTTDDLLERGIRSTILFLDANDRTLARRFEERHAATGVWHSMG